MELSRFNFYFHFLILGILPSVTLQAQDIESLYLQSSEINQIMVNLRADEGTLNRFYFMRNSPERTDRFRVLYNGYLEKLDQINFENLNTGGRVDHILLKRNLEDKLLGLKIAEKEYSQIGQWITFADKVYQLEKPRRRGLVVNGQNVAAELNNIAKSISASIVSFEKEAMLDKDLSFRLEDVLKDLQKGLESVYTFYNEYDPEFTWWVPQPYDNVKILLKDYIEAVEKKRKTPVKGEKIDASGIVGNPIGKEELIRQLQYEMIPYTPDELIIIANKEFAWCDAEMLKASNELGFGNDWHQALEKVKNTYVPAGQQPEAMLKLYHESVDFLKKKDLITIPELSEEVWRMQMMTPERQLVNPFFTGGEVFSISYPTVGMTHEQKLMSMRGNNPHFSRATVHHELIAGHHLQMFMNQRYKSYRNFGTPFWMEGWALYWEVLLWDQGFPQSPEDRIGMLFWRMHRCARIIFSLNYHLGNWTPQECIDFLVDRVGHERANAEGEVRRSFEGRYSPLYQLAYMIGGLQFNALNQELVGSGKMTFKQFHDAVMHENSLPIEMVRAILTDQTLPADFKTTWKFYGDVVELPKDKKIKQSKK